MPRPPSSESTEPSTPTFNCEIYSCLGEFAVEAVFPIPGLMGTLGNENIPTDSPSFLSGFIRKQYNDKNDKNDKFIGKNVDNRSLKSLQKKIKENKDGTHIICGHHNNMKENMKNILKPMSVLEKKNDLDSKAYFNALKDIKTSQGLNYQDFFEYEGWHNNTMLVIKKVDGGFTFEFVVPIFESGDVTVKEVVMKPQTGHSGVITNAFRVQELTHEEMMRRDMYKPIYKIFCEEADKYFNVGDDEEKTVCIIRHGAAFHNEEWATEKVKILGSKFPGLYKLNNISLIRDAALLPATVQRTITQGKFLISSGILNASDNITMYASPLLRSLQTLYFLNRSIVPSNNKVKGTLGEQNMPGLFPGTEYQGMDDFNEYVSKIDTYLGNSRPTYKWESSDDTVEVRQAIQDLINKHVIPDEHEGHAE